MIRLSEGVKGPYLKELYKMFLSDGVCCTKSNLFLMMNRTTEITFLADQRILLGLLTLAEVRGK